MTLIALLLLVACAALLTADARAYHHRRPCRPAPATSSARMHVEAVYVAFCEGRATYRALMDAEQMLALTQPTCWSCGERCGASEQQCGGCR